MLTADARQAMLQCPGNGHISEPISCNAKDQQGMQNFAVVCKRNAHCITALLVYQSPCSSGFWSQMSAGQHPCTCMIPSRCSCMVITALAKQSVLCCSLISYTTLAKQTALCDAALTDTIIT